MVENREAPWGSFDSESYRAHNYTLVRPDDRALIEVLADFLEGACFSRSVSVLDIGAGPNLFPALLVLPYAARIDLIDWAAPNVEWLRREVVEPGTNWNRFWSVLAERPRYVGLDFRAELRRKARIFRGSVFRLPHEAWDVGCMFYVAESITTSPDEFRRAVLSFVSSVRVGGILLAAFMENSEGYDVGPLRFPAFGVGVDEIVRAFQAHVSQLSVHRVDIVGEPLRRGYTGQIAVTAIR